MNPEIRIDAEKMRVEGGMMNLGKWNSVWYDRLAELLVFVGNNMGGIEKAHFRKTRKRTSPVVRL